MRIMALDIGTKRIGVAVSDETRTIAQGRDTIERVSDAKAVSLICDLAKAENVVEIVAGLPVNMDGSEGQSAVSCREFAEKIKKACGLPVKMWDERMTTMEAEGLMVSADVSRGKRKKVIDKMAAVIILQSYLDSLKSEQ